jgi:predicted Ser/Thr protein kinase
MSHSSDKGDVWVTPLRRIDLVAGGFEREWQQGIRPRIANYLDQVEPESRIPLLIELVCIDFEHRLRDETSPTLEEYIREFPELQRLSPEERADLEAHANRIQHQLGSTLDHVPMASEADTPLPRAIGRFSIAGRLGAGSQGEVFLSFHPELMIPVVVKWSRNRVPTEAAKREHLVSEGRILAGLEAHSNLLRVYDMGFHEGRPFLVLENVPGRTLEQYTEGKRVGPQRAAELVAALADGVHVAHRHGIVHQDINPRNVLIDSSGQPRLIDFGLAWLRSPWTDPDGQDRPDGGTPRYLSPEQADPRIGSIGPATDVFGLGALLYFLLTGRPLYDGATFRATLSQASRAAYNATALEEAGVPKPLAAVCSKALAREPQARFATSEELSAALRAASRRPLRRKVVMLAGLFLAAGAAGWWLGQPVRQGRGVGDEPKEPILAVQVWRPETHYRRLSEVLPVHTGDELQVRFLVPPGLHIGLCSINGQGKLKLLQSYPPQKTEAMLVYPGPDQTSDLKPPVGTELLLVCGRTGVAVSEAELQTMWEGGTAWTALASSRQLFRLQRDQVREEGERPRDFGAKHARPGSDTVIRRLDRLRERLKSNYSYFEGLAFAHE